MLWDGNRSMADHPGDAGIRVRALPEIESSAGVYIQHVVAGDHAAASKCDTRRHRRPRGSVGRRNAHRRDAGSSLQRAMRDIHRRSAGIIWLNPHAGEAGFEPSAKAIKTALPY